MVTNSQMKIIQLNEVFKTKLSYLSCQKNLSYYITNGSMIALLFEWLIFIVNLFEIPIDIVICHEEILQRTSGGILKSADIEERRKTFPSKDVRLLSTKIMSFNDLK